MSIKEEIGIQIRHRRLTRFRPLIDGPYVHRKLLISKSVDDYLENGTERAEVLRSDLELFANGSHIMVCLEPYEAREALVGLLNPVTDGIWDIRSRRKPGLRILGGFAERNCFIGLTWYWRKSLKDKDSKEWEQAIASTRAEWLSLFSHAPVVGDNIHDYLISNYIIE